jgi:hypothetical protein
MDRTARIIGVWIVGCVIVGCGLVIANVPSGEPWTDQRVALVWLGLAAVVLGAVGVVAEALIVLKVWRVSVDSTPVDITPEVLLGYFRTHTDTQARGLVAPYVGARMQVTGEVVNARLLWNARMVTLTIPPASVLVVGTFGRRWRPQLARLQLGQVITIVGEMERVEAIGVFLKDCQFAGPDR